MDIKSKLKSINLSILLILVIPIILNIIWFKNGNIMGTAESGLPFYNFQIAYNSNKDAWAFYALGHPVNIGIAAAPTYWFFARLQDLGSPAIFLQASFLWLIFVASGVAIYKLVKELFPEIHGIHALMGVLFYWFNPFSMVNIWNRFLNNFFVFYALLPVCGYLLMRGLRNKNYSFAILIGVVSAIFSYALTSMVFIILFWMVLFYLSIFYFCSNKQHRLFIVKFFLLTLFFWGFVNFWWIGQVFSYVFLGSFNAVSSTSFKTDTNYNTFSLISEGLGFLSSIFRLKHTGFFNNIEIGWVNVYLFPVIVFFEFLISSIFLLPLIVKKRNIYILMYGGLMLASIFFTKGNSPPLGEIFDRAFLSFPFLQLFRNPFEKFGFILSFSTAILFAVGCFEAERLIGSNRKFIYRSIVLFFLLVVWGFPFWTGYIFTSLEAPTDKLEVGYQVKVPNAYKDASSWLESQNSNFRLVVLPIGGEGITYKWDKGYSGVELSNQLLPKTSISFNTNIPFYDDISNNLERLILTQGDITKILDVLNSKYILVRKDIDWKIRKMRDPDNINARLENIASSSSLRKVKETKDYIFWEYTDWKDKSLYLTNHLVKSVQAISIEDLLSAETDSPTSTLYNSKPLIDENLQSSEIVHPNFRFGLGEKNFELSVILREDIIFPSVKFLPSSPLYPVILVKEKLKIVTIGDPNYKLTEKISLLGKRLVEAEKEAALSDFGGVSIALDNYGKQLKELYLYSLGDNPNGKNPYFVQEDLYKLFARHSEVIERLVKIAPIDREEEIKALQKTLKEFVLGKGIEPIFGYMEKPDYPLKNRIIYQYTVDKAGSYELLFNIKDWNTNFKKPFNEPIIFQIDENLVSKKGELKENGISFGFIDLTSGKHEIGWNALEPKNLVETPLEFSMQVDHGVVEKSFPVKDFDPYSTYILDMNYLIKKGSGALVSLEGNNDSIKKDVIQRQFRRNFSPDNYNYDIRNYTAYYIPARTTDAVSMIFSVFPWNNCHDIYRSNYKERCENEPFRRPYDRNTEISLSDVSLVKVMTEPPILKLEKPNFKERELPEITFNKLNNAEYQVSIKNAKEEYALILSELFDPAWSIVSQYGENIKNDHFLANGYANGWIIDKKGDYQFLVKFIPQDLLRLGQKISIISLILGLGFVTFARRTNIKK